MWFKTLKDFFFFFFSALNSYVTGYFLLSGFYFCDSHSEICSTLYQICYFCLFSLLLRKDKFQMMNSIKSQKSDPNLNNAMNACVLIKACSHWIFAFDEYSKFYAFVQELQKFYSTYHIFAYISRPPKVRLRISCCILDFDTANMTFL